MRISDWSSDVCSSDLRNTRTSTPPFHSGHARLGSRDLDDADAIAALDRHNLTLGDQCAIDHDVEQFVGLTVKLHDAALRQVQHLDKFERRRSDLPCTPYGTICQQPER